MNKKTKAKLHTRLKLIKKYLDTNPSMLFHSVGICHNVDRIKAPHLDFNLLPLFEKYPDCHLRSDGRPNLNFPVNGDTNYFADNMNRTIWSNPKRIALLNWLIEETKP